MLVIKQDTPLSTVVDQWQFIAGADYLHDNNVGYLMVNFLNEDNYVYFGVPTLVALSLVSQTSVGAYLNRVIKKLPNITVIKVSDEEWNQLATEKYNTEGELSVFPIGGYTI